MSTQTFDLANLAPQFARLDAEREAELVAREREDMALVLETAKRDDWPIPNTIGWQAAGDQPGVQVRGLTPRPFVHYRALNAADVHVIAGKLGTIATVSWHVGPDVGETDPAGHWFASRHTWVRIDNWQGTGTDLQVSVYETISSRSQS